MLHSCNFVRRCSRVTGVERSNGSKMRREEKTRKEKKRQEKTRRRRRRNTLLNRIQKWVSVGLCVVGGLAAAAAAADDQSSIGNVSVQIGLCVWVTLKCVCIKCGEADKCVCLEGR